MTEMRPTRWRLILGDFQKSKTPSYRIIPVQAITRCSFDRVNQKLSFDIAAGEGGLSPCALVCERRREGGISPKRPVIRRGGSFMEQ